MNRFEKFKRTCWYNLNRRAKTRKSYLNKNIQVRMVKMEFYKWLDTQYSLVNDLWNKNKTASINRINHESHYEISNIEIQDFELNTLEAKTRREESKFKKLIIISPDKQEKEFSSISEAAIYYNLNPKSLADVYRGQRRQLLWF